MLKSFRTHRQLACITHSRSEHCLSLQKPPQIHAASHRHCINIKGGFRAPGIQIQKKFKSAVAASADAFMCFSSRTLLPAKPCTDRMSALTTSWLLRCAELEADARHRQLKLKTLQQECSQQDDQLLRTEGRLVRELRLQHITAMFRLSLKP